MVKKRNGSYVYVTWLAKVLAGETPCLWSPWFKAHFTHDKRPMSFDLASWSADHDKLVAARVGSLMAEGWLVTLEQQNSFRIKGKTATLTGKPDIVARRAGEVLVVDGKTGQQRNSDFWQCLIYMAALPLAFDEFKGVPIRAEIAYRSANVPVKASELTDARRVEIFDMLKRIGSDVEPPRTPTEQGCDWCEIVEADCPERWKAAVNPGVMVSEF